MSESNAIISSDDHNADGTRKDAKLAKDYAGMGDCIKLINAVIGGTRWADKDATYRQAAVDRNVSHLEQMKAMTDWGSEDMTATTNAITAGKGYTAS
tara:strand:+ start:2862 stop:3152 length:291 start_codon:yes stop_codon:yes gene_type:complete